MNIGDAHSFTAAWLAAWNAHDLEAALSHFSDDAVFTSPLAAELVPGSRGVIRGKEALRAYWTMGLARNPGLHFELEGAYVGADVIVIHYRNHRGMLVCEVLEVADGMVTRGHATYAVPDAGRLDEGGA